MAVLAQPLKMHPNFFSSPLSFNAIRFAKKGKIITDELGMNSRSSTIVLTRLNVGLTVELEIVH